jgi:hypothetical protein
MIRSILAGVGFAVVAVLATVLYYEGLHLPFLGQVIDGAIAHRLEGYVELSEKTAAEAKAAEQKRQADAARAAADNFQKQLTVARAAQVKANADLEKGISEYEQKLADQARRCNLTDDDIGDIMHNGGGTVGPVGHH